MNIDRIKKVIQTEATTPDIGDFLLTHVPFKNLYLDAEGKKSITEIKALEMLLESSQEHKFIMIQGSNGSGKSHLIRWLKEKYLNSVDKNKEQVLLISRAHNTLQDALGQLLEADIFPQEIRENELKSIKNAKSNITGEELKKTINFNITLEIEADENNLSAMLDPRTRKWLVEYLKNPFIQNEYLLKSTGPLERIRGKIEAVNDRVVQTDDPMFVETDFAISLFQISNNLKVADARAAEVVIKLSEKFADARTGLVLREKVADYLNTKISNVIQRSMKLQTGDFKKLFASLRKILRKQGMNLTLFVEDINSFTGIDDALMEVLLTDHKAEGNHDYCRLISVVGSTNKFYNDKLNASIKERIKSNIYLKEESVLGDKPKLIEFAAKYINAINLSDDQVDDWYKQGADDEDMPIYTCPHKWADTDCDGTILSIFPFNETALWKLYDSLKLVKRTPRVVLKSIIAHVLELWCVAPETFLLNEYNFSNADISLPRWQLPLHDNANYQMGPDTAVQRGILLRLWGDGTTNSGSGRLGGLTADVFRAFNVSVKISDKTSTGGDTGKHSVDPPPGPTPPPPPPPQPPPGRPLKLTELVKELEDWLKNKTLGSHVIFRDLLRSFIVSSMDWELENVPMILVTNYINSATKVHIEGQNVAVGDGFVLPRNKESSDLLIALASWRFTGGYTWYFEGGSDYLISATAWLARHKKELIECVKAPKGKNAEWNLPLWNIAALYGLKTLLGGLDITKSSEEIAIDLLGTDLNYSDQAGHSKAWKELRATILKSSDYKEKIAKETLTYFSKSVGSAEAGETKYVFVDAFELLKQIGKLKDLQWNVENLSPADFEDKGGTWYYAARFLNMFVKNIFNVIGAEKKEAENYLSFFGNIFDNSFDDQALEDSIKKIKGFLDFLTSQMNLNYATADYSVLEPADASKKFKAALNQVNRLKDTKSVPETLMEIAKAPFDDIVKFYGTFIAFDGLLNDKEKIFSGSVDTASKQTIDEYKNIFIKTMEQLTERIENLGGVNNGCN